MSCIEFSRMGARKTASENDDELCEAVTSIVAGIREDH